MIKCPLTALTGDEAAFRFVAAREFQHFAHAERRHKAGKRLPDQERFLLPVIAHECAGGKAAEKIFFQGTISWSWALTEGKIS